MSPSLVAGLIAWTLVAAVPASVGAQTGQAEPIAAGVPSSTAPLSGKRAAATDTDPAIGDTTAPTAQGVPPPVSGAPQSADQTDVNGQGSATADGHPTQTPPSPATHKPPDTRPSTGLSPLSTQYLEGLSLADLLTLEVRVGSLFAESRLQMPSTVSIVNQEDWERRGARHFFDVLGNQPSTVAYPGLQGGQAIAIRGYAQVHTGRSVALLYDGVPLNNLQYGTASSGRHYLLDTLEQVQVIRGPGSAMYGTDAFHGVISLKTFSPDEDRYEWRSEFGSDTYQRAAARVSQDLGSGLRLNLTTAYRGLPNPGQAYEFTEPSSGMVRTAQRKNGWRAMNAVSALTYQSDDWNAELAYTGMLSRSIEAPGIGTLITQGANSTGTHDEANHDSRFHLGRLRVTADLPLDLDLELSTYFWHERVDLDFLTYAILSPEAGPGLNRWGMIKNEYRTGGKLLIRQESDDHRLNWVVGYEFGRLVEVGRTFYIEGQESDTQATQPTTPSAKRNIHSVFVSTGLALVPDRLRLTLGGRLDAYSDVSTVRATPRAGMVFAPTDNTALKLLYGRAFRAPQPIEINGDPVIVGGGPNLQPETIDTLELVFQNQHPNWAFDLTAFGSLWTDAIIVTPLSAPDDPIATAQWANVGRSRALGAEGSVRYTHKAVHVDASTSYVYSQTVSSSGPNQRYTAFPYVIFNLGLGYVFEQARLELYLFQRVVSTTTEGAPTSPRPPPGGVQADRTLGPYYRVDLHASFAAVPDHLWIVANLRNVLASDNRVPNLNNAEFGLRDMDRNLSLGLRAVY